MVSRYKVRITPRARQNLKDIVNYLKHKASAKVANKVSRNILQAITKLETFPEAHQVFEEVSTEKVVFRKLLKWEYKIVYTVDNDELIVLVVRIYHGRQNQNEIIEELKT